ncbi:MAG: uncharacterized protein QG667_2277 [Pseudomonadota bacterium]|nr:uncharacterized protein [Pseudomonadota bacterium]
MEMLRKYFAGSFIFTALMLVFGYWLQGWKGVAICAILGVLETSLSFDNAVVNATVLRDMSQVWRKRFLTWGMLIAVFGMRVVFPVLIVAVIAHLGPLEVLDMAVRRPDDYAAHLTSAHIEIAAFGGAFLLMVFLKYFVDFEKEVHWIGFIEAPLTKVGRMEMVELALALTAIAVISGFVAEHESARFLEAGIWGLVTYIVVDGIGALFGGESGAAEAGRSGAAGFLYLELVDASFSFDGVIGAFALSNNIFIIAAGLGIGAMFVRSMTIYLVDRGTLNEYRYLEHGAFWAIGVLAAIMLLSALVHVHEVVTGGLGAMLILLALGSSIHFKRKHHQS